MIEPLIKMTDFDSLGIDVRKINYGGAFVQDNLTLDYVGGKIHELGGKIDSKTKYSDLIVLLDNNSIRCPVWI